MRITLISLERELLCFGIRILSSCLRKPTIGHVWCLWCHVKQKMQQPSFVSTYSEEMLAELRELSLDSHLIGISLMSNQMMQAISITEYLKSHGISAPIIWGGVQPTVEPEECLKFADMVCIGEGEEAIVELAHRMEENRPYLQTNNIWFNTSNGIVRNELRPLIQNLDSIPFPDYSCSDHFVALAISSKSSP